MSIYFYLDLKIRSSKTLRHTRFFVIQHFFIIDITFFLPSSFSYPNEKITQKNAYYHNSIKKSTVSIRFPFIFSSVKN